MTKFAPWIGKTPVRADRLKVKPAYPSKCGIKAILVLRRFLWMSSCRQSRLRRYVQRSEPRDFILGDRASLDTCWKQMRFRMLALMFLAVDVMAGLAAGM